MTRTQSFLDRAGLLGLRLLGALNLVFAAAVLLTALFMASAARAQEAGCGGRDLMAALRSEDPAAAAEIDRAAAATPNGEGILWRIESEGVEPSWLFGTMHLADPRIVTMPPRVEEARRGARTVVIEATEILDPQAMMAGLLARPELTMFTDATTLSSLVPEEERDDFRANLQARGISPGAVEKMKPWMLSAMAALPACELARKASGAPFLDMVIATQARDAGQELVGLETLVEQLEAMASLPMEFHMTGLIETLKLGPRIDDVMETMISLYLSERIGAFWPLFRHELPSATQADGGFAAFDETMIRARNRNMAERAAPHVREGGAFIAVGALHLPGEDGVVALLRESGFTVVRSN